MVETMEARVRSSNMTGWEGRGRSSIVPGGPTRQSRDRRSTREPRATPRATLAARGTTVGFSLSFLAPGLGQDLVADAKDVLKTLAFREREVRCTDGTWLLMRIVPYRTFDDKIDGLVMSFVDIDEVKRNQHAREFAKHVVETVRESLLVLDNDLRVRFANDSFYRKFHTNEGQTVDRLIYDLGNRQWNIPELRRLLEEILPMNSSFDGFEVEHDFPVIGKKHMILNARRITSSTGEPNSILLAIEDFS